MESRAVCHRAVARCPGLTKMNELTVHAPASFVNDISPANESEAYLWVVQKGLARFNAPSGR
jgi:hypothetical protein